MEKRLSNFYQFCMVPESQVLIHSSASGYWDYTSPGAGSKTGREGIFSFTQQGNSMIWFCVRSLAYIIPTLTNPPQEVDDIYYFPTQLNSENSCYNLLYVRNHSSPPPKLLKVKWKILEEKKPILEMRQPSPPTPQKLQCKITGPKSEFMSWEPSKIQRPLWEEARAPALLPHCPHPT